MILLVQTHQPLGTGWGCPHARRGPLLRVVAHHQAGVAADPAGLLASEMLSGERTGADYQGLEAALLL